MKKNPFLSIWLSGANRVFATGGGIVKAAVRRQQTAARNEVNKTMMSFWMPVTKPPVLRKRRKRKVI